MKVNPYFWIFIFYISKIVNMTIYFNNQLFLTIEIDNVF